MVSHLVTKAAKNPSFLKELAVARDEAELKRRQLVEIVEALNEKDVFIDSLDMLGEKLAVEHGVQVEKRQLRGVLREDLGMRFRKVHPISTYANSEKN